MFSFVIRRFEGLPHRQWKPERMRKQESQKEFFLAFTDDEGVPRNVWSQNWTLTTVPVPSLIKTVSSCVIQIVCVITNQGSNNPNCLKVWWAIWNVHDHLRITSYRNSTVRHLIRAVRRKPNMRGWIQVYSAAWNSWHSAPLMPHWPRLHHQFLAISDRLFDGILVEISTSDHYIRAHWNSL